MILKNLKKIKIPDSPGVYFFRKGTQIIYIGKATSLRDRVKSYFPSTALGTSSLSQARGPIILEMLLQTDNIKWQEADSVLEALILEAELIKKYQPKYNTKEKSDKSFNYVCITNEEIPKVMVIRGKQVEEIKNFRNCALGGKRTRDPHVSKNSLFSLLASFGPFTNSSQLKEALKIVRRIFPFVDESSNKKQNYEFYKQLGLVPFIQDEKRRTSPLAPLLIKERGILEYKKNIKNIVLFFQGKKKKILKNLEEEMKICIKKLEFEKANQIKKQIFALKHINDVALVKESVFYPLLNKEGNEGRFFGFKPHPSPLLEGEGLRTSSLTPLLIKERGSFRVEAYDIAHMSGQNMVGAMVVVEDGEIVKNEYKKFRIKTQSGANDTGALAEILERRFNHTEWQYPNLIVVDGGKMQINVTKKILKKVDLEIPIVSVLKDERHKPKVILGDKILIQKYQKQILLANSEAHRFAITYHKNMRAKKFLK